VLADGTYDVIVVDAAEGGDGSTTLELTVLAGDRKGEVVTVTAAGLGRDAIDLLGLPASLVVTAGQPSVTLEG